MATIRKRGKYWHVQVRKKGHKAVTRSFKDKKIAAAWIKKTESEIERGIFQDITEAQKTTLAELMDRYAREVLPHKRAQHTELSSIRLLKREVGGLFLASVNSSHIATLRDKRLKQVDPQTVKRQLGLLQRIINTATKDWGINLPHGNPVQRVRMPKQPPGRDRRLQEGEEQLLLAASTIALKPIILFDLETAMRRGEIANMEWSHIDFKARSLLIPTTKTGTPRRIPLSKKAMEILRQQQERMGNVVELVQRSSDLVELRALGALKSEPVFDLKADSITQAFDRTCSRVGIENLRFHDLRHEATSRLFEKRYTREALSPMEVATITGHKDLKMLMRYTHLRAEDLVHKLG
jgi:integrase